MPFTGPEVGAWHEADWAVVAGAGHSFAWCAATAGMAEIDPRFETNWADIPAAGLLRGAVHRLTTSTTGRGQARHFVDVAGPLTGSLAAVTFQPDGPRQSDRLPDLGDVAGFADEFARLTAGHPLLIRTSWRSWARRDPVGRGPSISPYLWHVGRGSPIYNPSATYGGWLTPIVWSVRGACVGVTGTCHLTMYTGNAPLLEKLLNLQQPPRRRRRWLSRLKLR